MAFCTYSPGMCMFLVFSFLVKEGTGQNKCFNSISLDRMYLRKCYKHVTLQIIFNNVTKISVNLRHNLQLQLLQ